MSTHRDDDRPFARMARIAQMRALLADYDALPGYPGSTPAHRELVDQMRLLMQAHLAADEAEAKERTR